MFISIVRILIVGPTTSHTQGTLQRLAGLGWGAHSVASVREAETVLKTIRFKIVLCAEKLLDGVGYELAGLIERQGGTLFIGVRLSETCLWLPVVENGARSLGQRAMNPAMLESELEELLRFPRAPARAWLFDSRPASIPAGNIRETERITSPRGEPEIGDLPGNPNRKGSRAPVPEMAARTWKPPAPPSRRGTEPDVRGMKRMPSTGPNESKAVAHTLGKSWRG
jgi:hypothetical protein